MTYIEERQAFIIGLSVLAEHAGDAALPAAVRVTAAEALARLSLAFAANFPLSESWRGVDIPVGVEK